MLYSHHYNSPLGEITMASDGTALTGLWFRGQRHFPVSFELASVSKDIPVFRLTNQWLDLYFSGTAPVFMPDISLKGTDFQMSVWSLLLSIPYGHTVTYGQLARQLEERRNSSRVSAQAVGGAVGRNPISLIVPCHRVIGADGSPTGYAGGIERKRWLLALENGSFPLPRPARQ